MGVFLLALRDAGNVRSACLRAGISRDTAYEARELDPVFAKWWKVCLEDAIDLLEMTAWQMASRMDGNMVQFLLKAHRPDTYGSNWNVTHKGDKENPIQHQVSGVAVYIPENRRGDYTGPRVELPMLEDRATVADLEPGSIPEADWEEQPEELEDEDI
jgi:hypothetical protein